MAQGYSTCLACVGLNPSTTKPYKTFSLHRYTINFILKQTKNWRESRNTESKMISKALLLNE
jgi:hypothetical protein